MGLRGVRRPCASLSLAARLAEDSATSCRQGGFTQVAGGAEAAPLLFNDGKLDVITDIMSTGKTWNGSSDSGCLSFESASYIQELIGIWV